ncbi:hypothetical protein [Hyphococcus sp.]|uniref:hypothetical protein n=1 Tax=Hyphococcus sp. TaxID=2038636 RepID=UPI00208950B8|nr:MAG: hypothetical protein DHS20C04_17590 [Marinicaulis sp.]
MCAERKQNLNAIAPIIVLALTLSSGALASEPGGRSAGGISIGEGAGGITDRAYVAAPPNYLYVIEKERGSFLDCGEGQDGHATDSDGRDLAVLRCGVTLTETIVIPAAASSARIIIHY